MVVCGLLTLLLSLAIQADSIKVEVEQGWLQGEKLELVTKDGHYFSFKGIPYAAPPLGKHRFKAPRRPIAWKEIRNATKHGPVCVQFDIFAKKLVPSSEDCLFLNVYTPNLNPEIPLPVMFFIHGGGYESGSGNVDDYGPDFLVQHGVVLVTINYRLEVLGFLSLEIEEVPGNAGMKDQVAALRWVKKNIAKFGGDPENITVFGQSAGGVAAILHMVSPISKSLFKRAISMSGVPSCDWSLPYQPRRRAFVLGKQLGLDTNDPKRLLKFLQDMSADKLAGVSPNVLASEKIAGNVLKMFHFTPVIEKDFQQEHFLTEDPEKLLTVENANVIDVMIGHTSEEGIGDLVIFGDDILKTYSQYAELLVPRKILNMSPPDKILEISDMIYKHYFGTKPIGKDSLREFLTYINDSTFGYDIYRYIQILSSANKNIFVYKFSGISERNIYGKIGANYNLTGASHMDDLAYLFDPKRENLTIDKSSKEYKMIYRITKLFTEFAKNGHPSPNLSSGITWSAYNNSNDIYMDIGEDLIPGKGLISDAAAFWKTIFKEFM